MTILERVLMEINRLADKEDLNLQFERVYIPIHGKVKRFCLECTRCENTGICVELELYYQMEGKDTDAITIAPWLGEPEIDRIKWFVNMHI